MSTIEVEVYALSDTNSALRKFSEQINETIERLQTQVQNERNRLTDLLQTAQSELGTAQAALSSCRSYVDEEGHSPPCFAEAQAVAEAASRVSAVQSQISIFEADVGKPLGDLTKRQESLNSSVEQARAYLERVIHASLLYLRGHSDEVGNVEGAGTHGSRYQQARNEFFRRGAAGELENEPGHLQGWMRQEVNQGGYYHSPAGYDVAHTTAGIDIPENFTFNYSSINRHRPSMARRFGLPSTYY